MKMINIYKLIVVLVLSCASIAQINAKELDGSEKQSIKALLEKVYLQDWLIKPNPDGLKNGFHKDAIVYVMSDGVVSMFNQEGLYKYVKSQEKSKVAVTWKFEQIDLNEQQNMAMVKLRVYRDGKLSVVDFFSLYKTKIGWKIVAKVFQFAK